MATHAAPSQSGIPTASDFPDELAGDQDAGMPISGRHSLSYQDDKYCIDILTQISAIVASSRSVGLLLLEDHIRGCVVNASPEERDATLDELNRAIERFTRSVGN